MPDTFRKSILAGIFISLGGTVYLKMGGPIGAFLFSFGLLSVIHYKLPLYTGKAGFCKDRGTFVQLPVILLGNIVGCIFIGTCIHNIDPAIVEVANNIVHSRQSSSIITALFSSFMCGLIMTTIVKFARKGSFIPLLLGIPLFILSGYWHSIADAFYYSVSMELESSFWYIYLVAVLGNFIGCNTYNILVNMSLTYREEGE